MRLVQSLSTFFLFLLLVALCQQQVICDTPTNLPNHQPLATAQCSNESSEKCHHHLASPQAASLAGIDPIVAAASQDAFAINTPFTPQKPAIDEFNGIPAAFGDFDADHLVDMFFLTENGHAIQALRGQECSGKLDAIFTYNKMFDFFLSP